MPENRIFGQFCPNLPKKYEDLNGRHNFFVFVVSRELRYMLEGYYYTFKTFKEIEVGQLQ